MRLINVRDLTLESFYDDRIPPYVFLSHTWEDGEVLYGEFHQESARAKRGWAKIKFTCKETQERHLSYAWVDTCGIDKSSSAELQEAINSMYDWYSGPQICLVFLSDILPWCPTLNAGRENREEHDFWLERFAGTTWFTRGWTLQELIAPRQLEFFGSGGNLISSRVKLASRISAITGIQKDVINGETQPDHVSVARRMSWAAQRQTTRVEDRAYSLLGIFGVNMPMLYGEGPKAFIRLQEEIMKSRNDQSILAWSSRACDRSCVLAEFPADFSSAGNIVPWGRPKALELTSQGFNLTVPLLPCENSNDSNDSNHIEQAEPLLLLYCGMEDDYEHTLALRVRCYDNRQEHHIRKDVNGGSPHTLTPSNRICNVKLKTEQNDTDRHIILTRLQHAREVRRTFWFRFADTHTAEKVAIASCSPALWWKLEHGTVRIPPEGASTKIHVKLKTGSSSFCRLEFGCLPVGEAESTSPPSSNALEIPWLRFWNRRNGAVVVPCAHCDSTCLTSAGSCSKTLTTSEITRDGVTLHAGLETQVIKGEKIFVVTVNVQEDPLLPGVRPHDDVGTNDMLVRSPGRRAEGVFRHRWQAFAGSKRNLLKKNYEDSLPQSAGLSGIEENRLIDR